MSGDEQLLVRSGDKIVNNIGVSTVVDCNAELSGTTSSPSDMWSIAIIKNGGATFNLASPGGASIVDAANWKAGSGFISMTLSNQTTMAPSDTVGVYVANIDANSRSLTAATANLNCRATSVDTGCMQAHLRRLPFVSPTQTVYLHAPGDF